MRPAVLHALGNDAELAGVCGLLGADQLPHRVLQPVAVAGCLRSGAILERGIPGERFRLRIERRQHRLSVHPEADRCGFCARLKCDRVTHCLRARGPVKERPKICRRPIKPGYRRVAIYVGAVVQERMVVELLLHQRAPLLREFCAPHDVLKPFQCLCLGGQHGRRFIARVGDRGCLVVLKRAQQQIRARPLIIGGCGRDRRLQPFARLRDLLKRHILQVGRRIEGEILSGLIPPGGVEYPARPEVLPVRVVVRDVRSRVGADRKRVPLIQQCVHVLLRIPLQPQRDIQLRPLAEVGIRLRGQAADAVGVAGTIVVGHLVEVDARHEVGGAVDVVVPANRRYLRRPRPTDALVGGANLRIDPLHAIVSHVGDQPRVHLHPVWRLKDLRVGEEAEPLIRVLLQHALHDRVRPGDEAVGEVIAPDHVLAPGIKRPAALTLTVPAAVSHT